MKTYRHTENNNCNNIQMMEIFQTERKVKEQLSMKKYPPEWRIQRRTTCTIQFNINTERLNKIHSDFSISSIKKNLIEKYTHFSNLPICRSLYFTFFTVREGERKKGRSDRRKLAFVIKTVRNPIRMMKICEFSFFDFTQFHFLGLETNLREGKTARLMTQRDEFSHLPNGLNWNSLLRISR